MTQPDLVSKLREFVRAHNYGYLNPSEEGKPGHYWCLCGWEGPDRGSYWKHLDEALLAESLLGLEGQAAPSVPELCPSCQAADNNPYTDSHGQQMRACGRCMIQWVARSAQTCGPSQPELAADDEWWKVAALDVIRHARVDGDVPTWDRWRSCIINGLLGAFNRGQDSMRASSPSPSTPIVPSTPDDPRFDGVVVEVAEEFAILEEDIPRLRGILAELQPAARLSGETLQKLNELRGREARIRKDVLEEAAVLAEDWANVVPNHDRGYPKRFGNAIRALAERPAPAGEVKGEK